LLLGYAILGKFFAYLGYGSLYVGEIVLLAGILSFLVTKGRLGLLKSPAMIALFLLMCWGTLRTVPFVEDYGLLALRDAAIWGYGLFAFFLAACVIDKLETIPALLIRYRTFVKLFLIFVPIVWVLNAGIEMFPMHVNGRAVVVIKGTELQAHLVGLTSYVLLQVSRVSFAWLLPAPALFVIGLNTRAGILSFLCGIFAMWMLRPLHARWLLGAAVFATALVGLAAVDFRLAVPGSMRELSAATFTDSVRSIVMNVEDAQYDGTKYWRLRWWEKIVGYTVHGEHFWLGKGFGINLAYDDGFAPAATDPLRSPHNGHLTILARMGVPGLALWCLTNIAWLLDVLACFLLSRRNRDFLWSRWFQFLVCYWVALMVSATFDVFLEGPMAGIWFWSVFGVGAGSAVLYRRRQDAARPVWRYPVTSAPTTASAW
jgi:O-antigen ligase